jgi:hypothetical protein
MSPSRARRVSLLTALIAAVLTVGAFVLIPVLQGESGEEAGGHDSIADFLREHPQFRNNRSMALAFIKEKMEQSGGEASQEILNGPEQEQYDNRAFPRAAIGNPQMATSKTAAASADTRGRTSAGDSAQAQAEAAPNARSWTPIGPSVGSVPSQVTYTGTPSVVSGRTTALAFAGPCTRYGCVLYAGTAGGGVWRTRDALAPSPTWQSIGQDIPSTAIGSLTVAGNALYVGTGEPNGSSDSEAGRGLYVSTNGGASFGQVPTKAGSTDFTLNRSVAQVVVDPRNPRHLYVGTAVARHGSSSVNGGRYTPPGAAQIGLYESADGGHSWTLTLSQASDVVDGGSATGSDFFRGDVTKVQLDPTDPSVVYASVSSYGLYRRTGGSWQQVYAVRDSGSPTLSQFSRLEFAVTRLPNGRTRLYLGDATLYGSAATAFVSGLLRTDDARAAKPSWTTLSDPAKGTPGYGSYNFCETQCSYDMVVSSPPGRPDTVYLSGSMNYDEVFTANQPSNGRAVVRSTDAGVHVTDMTVDAQAKPDGLHPDHHALAFVPGSRTEAFVTASDGGVVRGTGPFVDASAGCDSRGLSGADLTDCRMFLKAIPTDNTAINAGLQTLQFQSVSLAPGGVVQGGTQDNGTWESDAPHGWLESVGGDGGQSGFDAKNTDIRYHSYYSPSHDVNFNGTDPLGWDYISDPLTASGEGASFYVPLTADPVNAGYVFDGLQHVWRTTDHGGDPDYLQKYCNELTGQYDPDAHPCGDWRPLGGASGDLSGTAWGSDNAGAANYVVAVTRPASSPSALWAGTRRGRLFVSGNANAGNPDDVGYTRLDQELGLPTRFISGIAADPANPYHVWVSYSGYSAYAGGGHVYEITYDPRTHHATSRDLSYDLGDQPITSLVVARTGALFAGTDYGVVTLPRNGRSWVATRGLPPVAVYGLTLDAHNRILYAATHGRSVWKLPVG